jgi:hypothetical protein
MCGSFAMDGQIRHIFACQRQGDSHIAVDSRALKADHRAK